jgi:hypothetical protein
MEMPATVELLGNERTVALPGFTEREELAAAYAQHAEDPMGLRRVYGAVIGLCTSLGAASGANWRASKCDVLTYGGSVYGYLREHGATVGDVAEVGISILAPLMVQLFPREAEVAEQAGFTPAAEGG